MSESGDRSIDHGGPADPTGGATAFDPTRDPWARPPEPPAGRSAPSAGSPVALPAFGSATPEGVSSYEPPTYSDPAPPTGEHFTQGQPPYGQPQYDQPQYGQPQYGQPQYGQPPHGAYNHAGGYPSGVPQTSGKATTVLVLGIASMVLLVLYGIGIVPAVISLVMSSGAKREIAGSGGRLSGLGMVAAGRVMSWITVGLFVILAVVVLVVVASINRSGTSYSGY